MTARVPTPPTKLPYRIKAGPREITTSARGGPRRGLRGQGRECSSHVVSDLGSAYWRKARLEARLKASRGAPLRGWHSWRSCFINSGWHVELPGLTVVGRRRRILDEDLENADCLFPKAEE